MVRVKRSSGSSVLPATLSASVQVTALAGVYRAKLLIRSGEGTGERTLEHTDCTILADSVALVIALSADDGTRVDRGDALKLGVSAHAAAISGTLPKLALGAGADLALEGLSLRGELSGTLSLAQTEHFRNSQIGASFRLIRLAARVCRVWSLGALELAPCLGAQLSRVAAQGFGGAQRSIGAAYLIAPSVGVFVRLRLYAQLYLRLAADLAAPIERRRFVYTDLGLLHRPGPFAGQLFIAPEVQF